MEKARSEYVAQFNTLLFIAMNIVSIVGQSGVLELHK